MNYTYQFLIKSRGVVVSTLYDRKEHEEEINRYLAQNVKIETIERRIKKDG
jgi:hypothetical protein